MARSLISTFQRKSLVYVPYMFHESSVRCLIRRHTLPREGREWERRSARLIKRPGTVESESGQAMPLTLSTFGLDNSTGFTQLIDWGGCWVTAAVDYKGFWLPEWLASGIIICMFNYKVNYWPYGEMCVTCCVVLVIMLSSSAVSFWLEWLAMATHNGLLHCTANARKKEGGDAACRSLYLLHIHMSFWLADVQVHLDCSRRRVIWHLSSRRYANCS